MTQLFRHRTENEFGRIEDSHGLASMQQELKVEYEIKGKGILEFILVEKRTKNKCPCPSRYSEVLKKRVKNCSQPCRIMFRKTTRIIQGFSPEKVMRGFKKMPKGNLNKTENKTKNKNHILIQNVLKNCFLFKK